MSLEARPIRSLTQVDASAWDALVAADNPFCRHAFLQALETSGCASAENGWQPFHLTLWDGDQLVGAAPCYLKSHSFGEFVFDWAWAHAYEQHGRQYYPKLLCGIPMSPVNGPRLLSGEDDTIKPLLAQALLEVAKAHGLSSAHVNFCIEADSDALRQTPELLPRNDIQFHWSNASYASFDDFLAALHHKKRKNIRQERRRVQSDGWTFEHVEGNDIKAHDLALMHQLYLSTFDKKGNWAPLTLEFFEQLHAAMPTALVLVFASRDELRQAGALLIKSDTVLYGRYWGTFVDSPGLHFETCYYQGIEYAIARKLSQFEPGAQGQHKLARGFLPTVTQSFHYIDDPAFRQAIGRALDHEALDHQAAVAYYAQRNPFRSTPSVER